MMSDASWRWMARLVGSAVPYSMLMLPKPFAPSGTPTLPATENVRPRPPNSVTRVLDVTDDARPARLRVPRIGIEEAPGLDFPGCLPRDRSSVESS